MIRKKPAPHLMRGGHRFSDKLMLNQNHRGVQPRHLLLHGTGHHFAALRPM